MSNEQSETVFQNALLADAAYVHFEGTDYDSNGVISTLDPTKQKFLDRGFTETQFLEFQANYKIVDHLPNTATGLSSTIFEDRFTQEKTIAFRGTEAPGDVPIEDSIPDLIRDIFLALGLDEVTGGLGQSPRIVEKRCQIYFLNPENKSETF